MHAYYFIDTRKTGLCPHCCKFLKEVFLVSSYSVSERDKQGNRGVHRQAVGDRKVWIPVGFSEVPKDSTIPLSSTPLPPFLHQCVPVGCSYSPSRSHPLNVVCSWKESSPGVLLFVLVWKMSQDVFIARLTAVVSLLVSKGGRAKCPVSVCY